jgi:hypothetical protein
LQLLISDQEIHLPYMQDPSFARAFVMELKGIFQVITIVKP